MNVEPELLDHPKYLRLRKRIGAEALEYLLRIWGHCSCNRRGEFWRGADAEYFETVARWPHAQGALLEAMVLVGFVEQKPSGLVIHDWEENNSFTVANWTRNLTGRPSKKKPLQASVKANADEPGSHREATGKPRGPVGDPVCMNECMKGVSDRACATPLTASEAEIPSEEEVRAWAASSPMAIDPDWAAEKAAYLTDTHGWVKNGSLLKWQSRFGHWWADGGREAFMARKRKDQKNGRPELEEIRDRLQDVRQEMEKLWASGDKAGHARLKAESESLKKLLPPEEQL